MKNRRMIQSIIQGLLILALLVFWWTQIYTDKITSSASFDEVRSSLLSILPSELYPEQPVSTLPRYFDLDPSLFDSIAFYRSSDALSASELCVARFSSQDSGETFAQAAKERQDSQHSIYEGYAPEQAGLTENALIDVQGNYAVFYIGDNPSGIENQFHEALKSTGGSGQ